MNFASSGRAPGASEFDPRPRLVQFHYLVHPIALQFGPFTITWYGVMVALGFLAGLWTASRRSLLQNVAPDKILDLGPWLIIGAIVGARTLYVVSYWHEQFAGKPLGEIFMVWRGGLVYYGGLIGSSLACILYVRFKKLPLWKMADILAPSVALGHVFGRIGCLLNGCCYGRACSLPWAIVFPEEARDRGTPAGIPLHPTQIYESLLNLALYLTLARLFRHRKFEGQVFGTYLVCYALLRSFVELFRGDYPSEQVVVGWITPAHWVSLGILVTGLILLWTLSSRRAAGTSKA
jgi:phosphatidylglycerol---prolipoprotein diacylglyceryl transferase